MQIDFISDLTCPWCAIGIVQLERAIARLDGAVPVALRLQPLELNPDIGPDGEDIVAYAARKYGAAPQELAARQALIRSHAAEAGLHLPARTRVFNTFDAHRLLLWAERAGRERALKCALLQAYHLRGQNPGARGVLLAAVQQAGLDGVEARGVLDTDAYAGALLARVRHWQARGVSAVPTILVNDRTVLRGGQTATVLEGILRKLLAADDGLSATPTQ
jgi:predicted DsbA family dithiol-disulfide isomerase